MQTIICGLTPDAIDKLKAKHGRLFQVDIADGSDTYSAIFKEPTMDILSAAGAVGKTDEIKASMVLYENCLIAADDAIKSRDMLKMQVVAAIGERMTALTKTVKNL